jgi:hypothetical protein
MVRLLRLPVKRARARQLLIGWRRLRLRGRLRQLAVQPARPLQPDLRSALQPSTTHDLCSCFAQVQEGQGDFGDWLFPCTLLETQLGTRPKGHRLNMIKTICTLLVLFL